MSKIKATNILCLADDGEQVAFTGVWLNHNSVTGSGKCTLCVKVKGSKTQGKKL